MEPEKQMTINSNSINLIKSYSHIFYKKLMSNGLHIDRDDLESDLSMTYVEANKAYRGENFKGAKFETFFVKMMKNRFENIRKRLFIEKKGYQALNDQDEQVEYSMDSMLELSLINDKIERELSSIDYLIFKELVSPDAQLIKGIPDCSARRYIGVLHRNIADKYQMSYQEFKYRTHKIRKKIKNLVRESIN
jgi:hypothetical protein